MIDGYVVSVFDYTYGSELASDASAAATSITVVDLTDFNEDPEGGSLQVTDGTNTETFAYTVPEDSTGEIDLDAALVNGYTAGVTKVQVLVNGQTITERWADVREPDGEDLLRCLVPHQLRALIPLGQRDEDAGGSEHVRADDEDGDVVVQDVVGKSVQNVELEAGDDGGTPEPEGIGHLEWRRRSDNGRVAALTAFYDPSLDLRGLRALARFINAADTGALSAVWGVGDSGGAPSASIEATWDGVSTYAVSALVPGAGLPVKIIDSNGSSDWEIATSGGWQNWTPTLSGWSANPTNSIYRYKQTGKTVIAVIRQTTAGTSNATTKSITAPVQAATITNMLWAEQCSAVDNGVSLSTSSGVSIASGSSTINFSKDLSTNTGGWTASGSHKISTCMLIYEAA